ncbi:hypothetical protein [Okeania sp. SIO3B5]|nr:hypothetical protein [Okeania sp. SIO3B5]
MATATVYNFDGNVKRVDSRWIWEWEEEEIWEINKTNIDELIKAS